VEIQLGALDESHIIRTIEYWDIERRRYPQYEHIAVIVAEDVTSRFLNVISLFNGAIPLIAVQIRGVEVNGAFTLVPTRVVDLLRRGTEEEDEGETVDRGSWERKSSPTSLQAMDRLVEMVNEVQSGMRPKYNKHYVGLVYGGQTRNFMAFHPRKGPIVLTEFKIPQDEELTAALEETGLSIIPYAYGGYRVKVRKTDLETYEPVFMDLIRRAHEAYQSH
jgi:hypothetical protein